VNSSLPLSFFLCIFISSNIKTRHMIKIVPFIAALLMATFAFGQPLTGTKTIPGSYATIAAAVAALNANGVGAGGVIFDVTAGHTETSVNILLTTTTASATNPIVFQKAGVGANPLITAAAGTSTALDGIIKVRGTDYVTFDGISIVDPVTNTTAATRMEFGFAILMTSATDASQNITIRNCSITLQKVYTTSPYSNGIYSKNHTDATTTSITPTSANGVVSNCQVDNCAIQDVTYGINWTGASTASYYGQNNYFGAITGNTITNFGGGSASSYGIYVTYQNNSKINNNQVTGGNGTTTTLYGIYTGTGTNSNIEIVSNTVTLTSAATTSGVYGIYNGIGGSGTTNTVLMNNNIVTINYPTATSGSVYSIYQSISAWRCDINSNSVVNCIHGGGATATATGTFYGLFTFGANTTAGSLWNITGNTVSNNSRIQSTRGTGIGYAIYNSSSGLTLNVTDNNVYSNSWPSSGSAYGVYISNSTATALNVQNNQVFDISKPGALINVLPKSGNLYGVYVSASATGGLATVQENMVYNLTNSWGGQVLPFRCDAGTASSIKVSGNRAYGVTSNGAAIFGIHSGVGLNVEIYRNRVYDLAAAGDSGSVFGICTGSTTATSVSSVYNNYVSDLRAPEANVYFSAGLYMFGSTGETSHRYNNNTVYLNQVGTSGSPSTAAVYANTVPSFDMRNNILINNSSIFGAGRTIGLWRSGITTSSYSASSNFNCIYAGPPGTVNLLYYAYDATTPHQAQTITQYLSYFPQEAQSFTENPPFINNTTKPYNLRLSAAIPTGCESGGSVTATPAITADFDVEPRFPNPGYPNNPLYPATAPDCGADEFGGIPVNNCGTPNPGNAMISASGICLGQPVSLSLQNTIPGTGISFQWQSSVDGTSFENVPGANGAVYTFAPSAPLYYQCVVTCQNGPVSATSSAVQVTFANNVTSVTPGSRCGTGTVDLQATVGSGILRWYASASGGTHVATGSPFTTPSLSSTTSYYAAADIPPYVGTILGAGASNSTGYEGPWYHLYGSKKSQYLVKASELTAAGLTAGNLSSLAFEVTAPGTSYASFNISIGNTSLSAMTTTLQTGLTSVYSVASVAPVYGVNSFTFTTPFYWDGTSNIIVETCWSNNITGGTNCSVKYDATSYVSQGYYRADNQTPAVLCATTAGSGTTSSRPKMYFNYVPPCLGPRTPVTATVLPPPALIVTPGTMVCSGEIFQIDVTSVLADYDVYTWSPVTNLYTDAACTVPYVALTNAPTVYFNSSTGVTTIYTCSASNTVTLCSNTAQTTVSALPDPVITASPDAICVSGSAILRLSPTTGYLTATFQWQESVDNAVYNDISGATSQTYTTPVLTQNWYYRVLVKKGDGSICAQPSYALNVVNPTITGTTPGSRCGTGIVTLGATASAGSVVKWYSTASGGASLATGNTFVTPVISTTTNYYVSSSVNGGEFRAGKTAIETNANGTSGGLNSYLTFTAESNFLLRTVDIFPYGSGAGTVTIELRAEDGTSVATKTVSVIGTTSTSSPAQTVELNFAIAGGANYRLGVAGYTGLVSNMYRDNTNLAYPYHVPGVVTITGTNLGSTLYYFYYNWLVSTGCESSRAIVIATINSAPAVTVSANPASVCAASSSTLQVSSANPNYTYTWMPGNLSGATPVVNPEVTTGYTVTATDTTSGCVITDETTVTVLATPSAVTITPAAPVVAPGAVQQLVASGGELSNLTILWQKFNDATNDWTTINGSTGGTPANAAWTLQADGYVYSTYGTWHSNDNSQFYLSNSDAQASSSTTATILQSPAFSTVGYTAVNIGFYHYLYEPTVGSSTGKVEVSTDGTAWTTLQTYNSTVGSVAAFAAANIALTDPFLNQPTVYLRYKYDCAWRYFWGIDNVLITGTAQVPVTWSPFTDLYSDAGTTTPYAGEALRTVYTRPAVSITYTGIALASSTGCQRSKSVTVTTQIPCEIPLSVNTTDVTSTGARLGWSEPSPAPSSGYEYEIRTSGAAGSGTAGLVQSGSVAAGVTFVDITGLNPGTLYHSYVRGNCGDNVYSDWTTDHSFTTLTLPPSVTGDVTNATCFGLCNGMIDITVTDGLAPFTYQWSNEAITEDISGLCSGNYSVTVTDANNQTCTGSWFVEEPSELGTDGASITDVSCADLCDGSIMPYAYGGTPPYFYAWSGPYGYTANTSLITGLCAGMYDLTLTDVNNCTFSTSFEVVEPWILQVSAVKQDVSCYGANDGAMQVINVSGGTYPYTFLWSTGATTPAISGLAPGQYWLTVTDSHGCEALTFNIINEPTAIIASGTVTNATCPGAADGGILVSVSGGSYPYAFLWSTGATTESISGVVPGEYGLTVTDASGCVVTDSWIVGQVSEVCANISVTGQINTTECYDATSTITVAGGGQVFEVIYPGFATFIAGSKISYLPGTKVTGGGKMIGKIAPSGPWCSGSKITEVTTGPEETPMGTENTYFTLYPNPTNGNFTIVQKGDQSYSDIRVEIFSMSGEKVMTEKMVGQKHEFRFADMPSGLYFVKLLAEDYVETIKLVKTR
jgi:hypothetical protein